MRKKIVYLPPKKNANIIMQYTMNLLLLTFFVALISFSTPSKQKQNMGFNSLIGGFGILPGGRSPFQNEAGRDIAPEIAPFAPGKMDINKLRSLMAGSGGFDGTGISRTTLGTTITMRNNIIFEEKSDKLKSDAPKHLDAIATILNEVDNRIILTGHTDSRPIEEPPFYSNWSFSAARARSVMQYLADKGVPYQRMAVYGMGSTKPITSNDNEAGRRLNDRVEITMVGELSGNIKQQAGGVAPQVESSTKVLQYKGFEFTFEEQ